MANTVETTSRTRCPQCLRPSSVCLCSLVHKIANDIKITIYRHPSETQKAVGTASLAMLCLENGSIIDTEVVEFATTSSSYQQILVFPPLESESVASTLITTTALSAQQHEKPIELIFLDGTWKKARKMYYLSKALHSLPKLCLDASTLAAHYTIRKAEKPGQLSTLEAIVAALSQIEANRTKYQPLLTLQQGMVEQQLAAMGDEARRRYRQ